MIETMIGGGAHSAAVVLVLIVAASAAGETASSVVDDEVGAWRVVCQAGSCNAYQYGRGGSVPTIVRVKPGVPKAPEIRVEGGPFTPSGEVRFTIDGEWVTGGLASTLRAESGDDLVLEPDDITCALARRMKKGILLELTVPRGGSVERVKFDLDGFAEALGQVIDP